MYNVDETGIKLTYDSGKQTLSAVKDSGRLAVLLTETNEKP
jgi:hypothetical protein